MKELVITVMPDGSTVVDAKGFAGKGCKEASEAIELAIAGGGPRDEKKKPDYFASNPNIGRIRN